MSAKVLREESELNVNNKIVGRHERQEGLDNIRQYSSRGKRSWRGGSYRGGRDGGPTPRSRLEEDEDGDFEMGGSAGSGYARRYCWRLNYCLPNG